MLKKCVHRCENAPERKQQSRDRVFAESLAAHLAALRDAILAEHDRALGPLHDKGWALQEGTAAGPSLAQSAWARGTAGGAPWPPPGGPPNEPSAGMWPPPQGSLGAAPQAPVAAVQGQPGAHESVQAAEALENARQGMEDLNSMVQRVREQVQEIAMTASTLKASAALPAVAPSELTLADQEQLDKLLSGPHKEHHLSEISEDAQPPALKQVEPRKYGSAKLRALAGIEDTSGATRLDKCVRSSAFELVSAAAIIVNTCLSAAEAQYQGIGAGYGLGVPFHSDPPEEVWPHAEAVFRGFALAFIAIFSAEFLIRVAAAGTQAVKSAWLWFDGVLLLLSVLEESGVIGPGTGIDAKLMRLLRLFRMLRLLRVVRTMAAFDSLFLLITSIRASMSALVWSFAFLALVQVGAGLVLHQLLADFVQDESKDSDIRREIFERFGTFTKTMLTMFEITMANWVPSCRLLTTNVSELYAGFYIVYRCIFCFAVIKVITAVFIAETNQVLENDDEVAITKKRRARERYISKLRVMFHEIDVDGDGYLAWEEFEVIIRDELLRTWLSTLDIDAHDFETLFNLLDDGDGSISIDEFLAKVGTIKGAAKSVDMMTQLHLMRRIEAESRMNLKMQQMLSENLRMMSSNT